MGELKITRGLAETRCRKRWKEQADQYPIMANELSCAKYVAANWRHVAENDLLASYDRLPNYHPAE